MNNPKSFGKEDFQILERENLYSGIFKLTRYHIRHRLFQGGWSQTFTREVMERLSAVGVIPYDAKEDKIILIEQFRPGSMHHASGPWLYEIPAGVITDNNSAEKTAYAECDEEAGCEITELYPIYDFFVSPGGCNEYLNLYCGRANLKNVQGIHGLEHEHENIRVLNLSFDEAIKKLEAGEIKTVPAIIAILWLQLNREKMRAMWT